MNDGYLGKCKSCTKKDAMDHRILNIEKIRAYDCFRAKLPRRKKLSSDNRIIYRKKNPEKYKAHYFVMDALRSKKIIRPKNCEKCLRVDLHAHHDDYSKPLDVKWLCPVHHAEIHRKLK